MSAMRSLARGILRAQGKAEPRHKVSALRPSRRIVAWWRSRRFREALKREQGGRRA